MPEWKGLVIPVKRASGGYFTTRTTREVIRSSLQMILHTRLGERVMLPEFGSRLKELVFEQNDDVLVGLARTYIVDAIRRWERRVELLDVKVDAQEHTFTVNLRYHIRSTAEEDLLVLEFERDL
jgi:phage baseplate assembly protein W